MGTWNRKLFSNDTACDIRDTYIELLRNQYSEEEAYDRTCREYSELIGSEEEPSFWFAIAAVQWQVGRLTPDVREKALSWIEAHGGMELWEGTRGGQERWETTLSELKELLMWEMPHKKKFKTKIARQLGANLVLILLDIILFPCCFNPNVSNETQYCICYGHT